GGHRAEQAAAGTGAHGDGDRLGLEAVARGAGLLDRGDLAGLAGPADLVDLLLPALGPGRRQAAGHEVVAGVAVLDLDDVAGLTESGDLVGENDLGHVSSSPVSER